ncbi:MAG TPA: GDSL-type esterase/lipase family protein, partial [Chthoniobacteraceae bacterium]
MRPTTRILTLLLLLITPVFATRADEPAKFEIRDGDRVVFLGDTLLERENTYGYLETRLVEQFADRHFTVRNLSWSGDTPHGVSRAMFDPPEKGWERLKEALAAEKPTVVFLGYGMASSLQEIADRSGDITMNPDPTRYGREPMSAARFRKELAELIDAIQETAKGNGAVRIVLLSPIRHEDLRRTRPGLPDPAAHNALLDTYSKEIESLAKERNATFVSLARLISGQPLPKGAYPQTSNGIHLNESGYSALASAVSQGLGWWPHSDVLPANTAKDPLRLTIIRKNQLFFHRFRPENWTYLFGFRKHEQGQNAVEIPKFDPLIAKEEQEIDRLKKMPIAARFAEAARAKAAAKAQVEAPETPKELPKFDVEKGFEIELWATNPLLEKPIEMNWDSAGRLWIASSNTYPQVNPEDVAASLEGDLAKAEKNNPATGNDKVLIIEDPGHAGKATKSTVFADGLLIPTCVAPFRDSDGKWGCYVGASTELIALVDTTGSGHADSRQIILSGLGTEDTHQNVHTLRWAPDGRLYFDQSIYIHS